MANDFNWDEVLLTRKPKQKEIEVSFKKIDGDGFLGSEGDEGGTPGGVGEGPDGVQPPIDPEGDFYPIIGEDGEGPVVGGPIDGENPECSPADCEAYDGFSDPNLDASPHLIYDNNTPLAVDEALPGTVCFDRTTLIEKTTLNPSVILTAGSTSVGPCNQPPGNVYGVVPWTGAAAGINRCIPASYFNQKIVIGRGQEYTLEGSFGCYVMDRDAQGNVKTTGSTVFAPVYLKPIMYRPSNPTFYSGGDELVTVRNIKTGGGGSGTTEILTAGLGGAEGLAGTNDLTGTTMVSWAITYALDDNGYPGIAMSVNASHNGAQISSSKVGIPSTLTHQELEIDLNEQVYLYYYANTSLPVLSTTMGGGSGAGGITSINKWKQALEQSMQDYTPPDYCNRIPT